jgi:hypothetical protein
MLDYGRVADGKYCEKIKRVSGSIATQIGGSSAAV